MRFKNLKMYSLVFILLIATFFAGVQYNNYQKQNQYRERFLNQIYFELNDTIKLLSTADKWGDSIHSTDGTHNFYTQLLKSLNTIKIEAKQAEYYNGYNVSDIAWSFDLIEQAIGNGIEVNDELICYDFLNDGIISNNEASFLNSLKGDLETIRKGMYSEITNQENSNLSLQELHEIFKPFTDKYINGNLHNIGLKN